MDWNVDPVQLIQMIKGGQNPQQLMLSILEKNFAGTPMGENLLTLAKNGQTADIEQIARNICNQQGRNFDQEFKAFREQFQL